MTAIKFALVSLLLHSGYLNAEPRRRTFQFTKIATNDPDRALVIEKTTGAQLFSVSSKSGKDPHELLNRGVTHIPSYTADDDLPYKIQHVKDRAHVAVYVAKEEGPQGLVHKAHVVDEWGRKIVIITTDKRKSLVLPSGLRSQVVHGPGPKSRRNVLLIAFEILFHDVMSQLFLYNPSTRRVVTAPSTRAMKPEWDKTETPFTVEDDSVVWGYHNYAKIPLKMFDPITTLDEMKHFFNSQSIRGQFFSVITGNELFHQGVHRDVLSDHAPCEDAVE